MFISNERESMHSSTPAPPMSPRISWNKIQVLRRASKALHGWESGYICGPMLPWRSSLPVCSGSVSPIADPLPGVLCPQTCAFPVPSLLSGRHPIATLSASWSLTLHLKWHLPLPISLLCLILLPVTYLFSRHLALGHIHLLVCFTSVSLHRRQVPSQDQKRVS